MREPDDKTRHRQKLMGQIYELAKREEEFARGEIGTHFSYTIIISITDRFSDATDRFFYDDEDTNPCPKQKTRRRSGLSNDESDTESMADSAHLSKKMKKISENTSPAKSPAIPQSRNCEGDSIVEDCKSAFIMNDSTSNAPGFIPIPSRGASSPHGPWEHPRWNADSKDPALLRSLTHQDHLTRHVPRAHQPYTISSPWLEHSSPASFNTPVGSEGQPACEAIAIEAPTSTFSGQHDFQFPQTTIGHAQNFSHEQCAGCVPIAFPQRSFQEGLSTGDYGPANFTNLTQGHAHASQQHQFTPGLYQSNPESAQAQYFATSSESPGLQINAISTPNFRSYPTITEPSIPYSVDQSDHCPQPNAFPYPEFRPATDFQAPARVDRGFTGHGSGVGGGAFT